ncbi:MAG: sphingosine kinase [Deltaproteobacteria bacterium]|nr:sphingosine kinase [Deltaproteobacteria bacterium]
MTSPTEPSSTAEPTTARAKIGVVVNPRSKRNLDDPGKADRLRRIVGEHGVVLETRGVDELDDVADRLRREGIGVLAVAGGDGTTSAVLTAVRRRWPTGVLPSVALLRGGTMNTVANSVGIPRGRSEALLTRLVERVASGEPVPTTTRVTVDAGGRLGFLLGTGAMHGFMAEYYARGKPYPTPLTAAETLVVGAASAVVSGEVVRRIVEPIRATLTVGGERWAERDYFAVAAGTVQQIGLGFKPFHRANHQLDAFHVLGIHCSPVAFVASLPRIHRGLPMRSDHVTEALVTELVIETPGGDVPHMLDGDLHAGTSPFRVALGPRVTIVADDDWIPPARAVRQRARFELWRWLRAR